MKRQAIKLLKDWKNYPKGTAASLSKDKAAELIKDGIAEDLGASYAKPNEAAKKAKPTVPAPAPKEDK